MTFFQYTILAFGIVVILMGAAILYFMNEILWYLPRILRCLDALREIACAIRDNIRFMDRPPKEPRGH